MSQKWVKKGFDRVGHVVLPHKRKSCDIFRKLFYHSTSFLSSKRVLIHLYRNSSSETAIAAIVPQVLYQLSPFVASVIFLI